MKIVVNSIKPIDLKRTLVSFDCDVGNGIGRWSDPSTPPQVGTWFDVEIDVHCPLLMGDNTSLSESTEFQLAVLEDTTVLNGEIEQVDDDGMSYLRLASDCVAMIDCPEKSVNQGEWVSIRVNPLDLSICTR